VARNAYHPGQVLGIDYTERPANYFVPDMPSGTATNPAFVYTVAQQAMYGERLREAMQSGYFSINAKKIKVYPNLIGATIESDIGSVDKTKSTYGSYHNEGHNLLGFINAEYRPDTPTGPQWKTGIIGDVVTAIRDPIFFEWHKNIDNLSMTWQETQPPNDLEADAPEVLLRKGMDFGDQPWTPDLILCKNKDIPGFDEPGFDGEQLGEAAFGALNWDTDFTEGTFDYTLNSQERQISTTRVLTTRLVTTYIKVKLTDNFDPNPHPKEKEYSIPFTYLAHDEFSYFVRVENKLPIEQKVTVRLFIVLRGYEEERLLWIEMDKFLYNLKPNTQQVIFRQDEDSSVVRKPTSQYKKLEDYIYNYDRNEQQLNAEGDTNDASWEKSFNNAYCLCGWPYELLLPRGTKEGAEFTMLVMITDGDKDHVQNPDEDCCGSMSFCSAKTMIYPDVRTMGYPFDRLFKRAISDTIAIQPNMMSRVITVQELEDSHAS
jgi:hypothetical protein